MYAASGFGITYEIPNVSPLVIDDLGNNGSFETGNFQPDHVSDNTQVLTPGSTAMTGWTVVNDNIAWIGPGNPFGVPAGDGNYFLDLTSYEAGAPFGGVEQAIPTVPGGVYRVNFLLGTAAQYGGTAGIDVIIDGNDLGTKSHTTIQGTEWTSESQVFTAIGSSTTIRLLGSIGDNAIGLDLVTVDTLRIPENPVPDAGCTFSLLGVGLLSLNAIRRKL